VRHTGADIHDEGRDVWYGTRAAGAVRRLRTGTEMNAEDPLFILYTSGSTGKPKGVLHTTGGYLVWAAMTHEYVFDYRPGDRSTGARPMSAGSPGHSYVVYGPLPTARPP
jgi:acetyl-CoA synthetase